MIGADVTLAEIVRATIANSRISVKQKPRRGGQTATGQKGSATVQALITRPSQPAQPLNGRAGHG